MSTVAETSDVSVHGTEVTKPTSSAPDESTAVKSSVEPVDEARNDAPTTDKQTESSTNEEESEKDDVAITINGTTIVLLPEDTLVSMNHWVDGVNEYWDLKEEKSDKSAKKSAREKLTASLTVMGNGVRNKTVKITHSMAAWIVSAWKSQSKGQSETREIQAEPDYSLKQKFNDFLEYLKFSIPEKKDAASVFSLGAFQDDDSTMNANTDVEVMLAESTETETSAQHEC